jgi:drug/metabolite transporter (DMT)-like permease
LWGGIVQLKKIVQLGPVLIVIAALLWALDGVLRRSLFSLPPITIVFFEHLIGSLLLLPFVLRSFNAKKMTKQVWLLLGFVSLLSGLLGTLWFTTALLKTNFIPFSVVFLLQKLQPLFAIVTAAVLLKEKITKQYLPWAGLALASAFFVTFPNGVVNFTTGEGTIMAALFAVGAAAAWGTSTAFSRLIVTKISHTQATGWRFFFTTLFAGVGLFLLNAQASVAMVEPTHLFRLLVIALSTGMVALWLYYRGLEKTEAKVSTLLELAFPLLAVFIDMFLYKSYLQPSQYIAAVVLMFAIYRVGKLGVASKVATV